MGMFDYIKCNMPLPETPVPPPSHGFQTKDTPDQYMTEYTITEDGRLSWKPYRIEEVPKAERPYPDAEDGSLRALCGILRRAESDAEFVDYHGDIFFYAGGKGRWWEYKARFTDGKCEKITLEEFRDQSGG